MTRFLSIWFACLAGLALAVLCLTAGVDPYGILGTPRVKGWTARKVVAPNWSRLTKPYLVRAAQPRTLLLGSSTVDVGVDPGSPAWPAALRPVFNLGIFYGSPRVQLHYLRDALAAVHPALVLVGSSFDDAIAIQGPAAPNGASSDSESEFEQRLQVDAGGQPNPHYRWGQVQNLVLATLSAQAIRDSVATLLRQGDPFANAQTPAGFNTGGPFTRWLAEDGQLAVFADKERYRADDLLRWRPDPRLVVQPVAEAARLAQEHGARVIVFLLPVHAESLELVRQAGLIGRYLAWKRQVFEAVGRATEGRAVVWDFGGFSPYTTEAVPGAGDRASRLRWVWEPVHFRPELGALMVQRMLGLGGPEAFGAALTDAVLERRAAAFMADQAAWETSHPEAVARLHAVLATEAPAICHAPLDQCPGPVGAAAVP